MEKKKVVLDGSVYVFAPSGGAFGYLNALQEHLKAEDMEFSIYSPGNVPKTQDEFPQKV